MKKRGPPSKYNQALAAEICERLANGESLRSICRDEHMPSDFAVRNWVIHDVEGFASHYTRARDAGLDVLADEVLEIADDGTNDWMEKHGKNGGTFIAENGEAMARSRLRFDARRWYLSKLAPKRYGDRQAVELSGSVEIRDMSEEDMRAELAALVAKGIVLPGTETHPDDGSDLV